MKEGPDISRISVLIGDPARANMLMALMGGQALTAGELAREASITAQTASSHLTKLEEGRLLYRHKQGRHHYFAIANDDVVRLLEVLIDVSAGSGHMRTRPGPKDEALRKARVCYDHLAGSLAVRLLDQFVSNGFINDIDHNLLLTDDGRAFFNAFQIDIEQLQKSKRPMCRACLDWSERRRHLAGHLGAALYNRFLEMGWADRNRSSRVVTFTPKGLFEIRSWSGLSV